MIKKIFFWVVVMAAAVQQVEAQQRSDYDVTGAWRIESLTFEDPDQLLPKRTGTDSLMFAMQIAELKRNTSTFHANGKVTNTMDPDTVEYTYWAGTGEFLMGRIFYKFAAIDQDHFTLTESRANGRVKAVMRFKRVKR